MNQKQIVVYSFTRANVSDQGEILSDNLENNQVILTDNFLLLALQAYNNVHYKNGQVIDDIIKVILPKNEDIAYREWTQGLVFNGSRYYAWFATTGGMKVEDDNGICETIFIREDVKDFATEFEDLISLGKFREIEAGEDEICINKDVLSRISLTVSSSEMAGELPNFIVLPQPRFHISKDYKTVEKVKNKDDEVDYNLIDYHFDDEIDIFDGGGIATPEVFTQIEKELGMDYPIEFAIIRGYGLAIKGMITKFDIIGYLDEHFIGDTAYCRKVDKKYYLLDMWGEWQVVTHKTMLLNESMIKLSKYYEHNGMASYKKRLEAVDPKYGDIIGKLYVTKVNKKDSDIKEYRRTNYQLINALALSKKDYYDLLKDEVKTYRRILKPFINVKGSDNEQDEWKVNIDSIRLFFKNVVDIDEESEEFNVEVERIRGNVVSKCEELLNISEDFVKLKFVKNNLARLIEKRARDIAIGKFTVKAKYQYIAVCPISYMNFAMNRVQGSNGLDAGEFYSADCQNGDIRTISRNPLCAYSEVHNISFVKNDYLNRWLSPCRELIYFNQKSDILALMSGADTDGDACTVIDNEIIRNAVVVPQDGKYFINMDEKETHKMKFTSENRFFATFKASGNLIGKISLKAASINSNSQNVPDYFDTLKGEWFYKRDVNIPDLKERDAYIKEKLDSGEWLTSLKADDQLKNHMRQLFYENEKDIYIVLYNAMVSIDAPKTLYFPSSDDMRLINKKYGSKPKFLQYKEKREDVVRNHYVNTYGLLDVFTKHIRKQLLNEIESVPLRFDNRVQLIQEKLINGEYSVDDYEACFDEVASLYKDYTEVRKQANTNFLGKKRKESNQRDNDIHAGLWNKLMEDAYLSKIAGLKRDLTKEYKEIDAKFIVLADKVISKYDMATISNALGTLENCTEGFIINLFFPVFGYLNEKLKSERYVYVRDTEGEVKYLQERYRKVPVEHVDNRNIVRNLHLEEKKRLKVIDVKGYSRARVLNDEIISLIESELGENGYMTFDVDSSSGKVLMLVDKAPVLQVFDDWTQFDKYNLKMCSSLRIEAIVDIAKNRKSLKFTVTSIDV